MTDKNYKPKRNQRMLYISHYLVDRPGQLINLSYFVEFLNAAKSSISEDIDFVREVFEINGLGEVKTFPGAAGGIIFYPKVPLVEQKELLNTLIEKFTHGKRILQGNYIHMSDILQDSAHSIRDRIQALNGELADMMMNSSDVLKKLREEKAEIQAAMREQMAVVNKESLLEYSQKRVEELREDAKNAADCLDAIEKMLFLMDEYSRYKTRFVEESINGMFRIARFRLFREQANGGVEDRCDVVHDGVPYISVNNGMKINLGIDIINTLSMAYGVRVPLFVDNAESVTQLETSASQIIRLVVNENDKELRVNYEN